MDHFRKCRRRTSLDQLENRTIRDGQSVSEEFLFEAVSNRGGLKSKRGARWGTSFPGDSRGQTVVCEIRSGGLIEKNTTQPSEIRRSFRRVVAACEQLLRNTRVGGGCATARAEGVWLHYQQVKENRRDTHTRRGPRVQRFFRTGGWFIRPRAYATAIIFCSNPDIRA